MRRDGRRATSTPARTPTRWTGSSPRAPACRGWSTTCSRWRGATRAPSSSRCRSIVGELIEVAVEGVRAAHPDADDRAFEQRDLVIQGDHDQLLRRGPQPRDQCRRAYAPGGPIRVRAVADGRARLQVIDSGPGLPPDRPPTSSNGSGAPTRPAPGPAADRAGAVDRRVDRRRLTAGPSASTARWQTGSTVTVCLPLRLAVVRQPGSRNRQNRAHARTRTVRPRPGRRRRLKRDAAGLVVAVVQQYDTGEVLMVGWMDDEALHRTLTTGRATYWSRSRQEYWVKGDTSGHVQLVKSVALDCDGDALLVKVDQVGAACHTGDRTCFDAGPLDGASTHDHPRRAGRTGRDPPARPDHAHAVRRRRDPGRRVPQARGRPSGHVPARIGRARPLVLALVVRRRERGRHAVGVDGGARSGPATCRRSCRPTATRSRRSARRGGRSRRPACRTCRR